MPTVRPDGTAAALAEDIGDTMRVAARSIAPAAVARVRAGAPTGAHSCRHMEWRSLPTANVAGGGLWRIDLVLNDKSMALSTSSAAAEVGVEAF
jgi:hypothetical protein